MEHTRPLDPLCFKAVDLCFLASVSAVSRRHAQVLKRVPGIAFRTAKGQIWVSAAAVRRHSTHLSSPQVLEGLRHFCKTTNTVHPQLSQRGYLRPPTRTCFRVASSLSRRLTQSTSSSHTLCPVTVVYESGAIPCPIPTTTLPRSSKLSLLAATSFAFSGCHEKEVLLRSSRSPLGTERSACRRLPKPAQEKRTANEIAPG